MNALTHAQFSASVDAEVTFSVPIEPRGWTRALKKGNRFFVDEETAAFKRAIGAFAHQAMHGVELMEGPLALVVISILPIPPSWSQRKRDKALAGELRPTAKPDFDNLAKGVADALNGIVFRDDAQIVDGRSIKFYGPRGEVQVAVRRIQSPQSHGRPAATASLSAGALSEGRAGRP